MERIVKNKLAVANVISALMKNPQLVLDDRYPLTPDDFPERFHKIIFAAIDHIAHSGAKVLDEIVVDDYLAQYPQQHKVFEDNSGMEYLQRAMEISESANYEYYHMALKKCSLLNQLAEQGYDIRKFYDPDAMTVEAVQSSQANLDQYSLSDIIDYYDMQISALKGKFCSDSDVVECHISKGMRELKSELSESPSWGLPMNSAIMTTICHGRRLKKFYLKSLSSGLGKTRISIADACRLAIPEYYDPDTKKWLQTTCERPVLFITTELELSEIQTMLWAYVACVPEEHILDNKYVDDEEERVEKAIRIVESSKFYAVYIANFDMEDIESIIKRHKIQYGIEYVFHDYIFTSAKIFTEMSQKARGFSLREDQSLMVFSDKLKSLCNKYNIHIDSSTQTNDEWKTAKNPDQSVIRGAKAIADKVDIGFIGLEPSEKDKEAIGQIMPQIGMAFNRQPNLVYHVYKVRRGKYNHVKVFIHFDYGTLRTTDMFVTDRDYHLLDIKRTNIEVVLEQTDMTEEAKKLPPVPRKSSAAMQSPASTSAMPSFFNSPVTSETELLAPEPPSSPKTGNLSDRKFQSSTFTW